ncbi:MAG: DUF2785 domain-containing protein [Clostridiaceae bacterium]
MKEKEQLILNLIKLRDNNYDLAEGENVHSYAGLMLRYIGDPDPELRDDLIYSTFCEWICGKEYFNEEELRRMLSLLLDDNHLFYHIGSFGDNTVFTRTFSILAVVLILSRHREKPFLDNKMFTMAKDKLLAYYRREKDLRGYTDDCGWAHGAAHGADAMDELVQCGESDESVCIEVLEAIQAVLWNGKDLLCNEEDERIARVVYRIIRNNLMPSPLIHNWILGLSRCCEWDKTRIQYVARVNSKNLVRCLYFKLEHNNFTSDIKNTLITVEKKLNRFSEA